MNVVTIRSTMIAVALLIIPALLLIPAVKVGAQMLPPPDWDHYLPFHVQPPITWAGQIELSDQFGLSLHDQFVLTHLALPVDKNNEGIFDDVLHYTWWEIFSDEGIWNVVAENQFGTQLLQVSNARYLWNPALKNSNGAPGDVGPGLPFANHYKCYDARGPLVGLEVSLAHQFDPGIHTEVLEPVLFCNPAKKFHVDTGQVNDILDPDRHYVCYRLQPPVTLGVQVGFADQFVSEFLDLDFSDVLCVPTIKTGFVQAEASSWGRLKAIYR